MLSAVRSIATKDELARFFSDLSPALCYMRGTFEVKIRNDMLLTITSRISTNSEYPCYVQLSEDKCDWCMLPALLLSKYTETLNNSELLDKIWQIVENHEQNYVKNT